MTVAKLHEFLMNWDSLSSKIFVQITLKKCLIFFFHLETWTEIDSDYSTHFCLHPFQIRLSSIGKKPELLKQKIYSQHASLVTEKNIRFNSNGIDSFIKCPIGLGCQVGAVLAAWVDVNLGQH